ncbi:MAG: 4-alpha-glucanotransferase [Oscillospiraceae bacterium]
MIKRASGVLLPVFSLPGPYGCGTMGRYAEAFIDFLANAGQRYWQILPLVPSGGGNSPYMSTSTFAGNCYFIDPESLFAAGWVTEGELHAAEYPDPDRVDYAFLADGRMALLRAAWRRAQPTLTAELDAFRRKEQIWLDPYCTFVSREAKDPSEGDFHVFLQYLFFTQWANLLDYAHEKNVKLIGDLPIYVSMHGADVLSDPTLFQLQKDGTPKNVAGVPPDAFTELGQLWGNPLYDWTGNQKGVFDWWAKRIAHTARLCDVVRIDHFRGFHTYWSVPADAEDARSGHWEKGPGQPLVECLKNAAPNLEIIAEDLGNLDADALSFFAKTQLPGMKVLLYAFDPVGTSAYLPFNCQQNSIIYTGTHDAPTFLQWFNDEATPEERQYAIDYLGLTLEEGIVWGAIRGAWASPSTLAMTTMEDVLSLGADARMNLPGTVGPNNWSWRVRAEACNDNVAKKLAKLTHIYRREG